MSTLPRLGMARRSTRNWNTKMMTTIGSTSHTVARPVSRSSFNRPTSVHHAVSHDEDHGGQGGEGDEAEAVHHGIAALDTGGQPHPQGRHQGHGDGGGGDPAGI